MFVSQLPDGNDPNAGDFREKLPAGFLRCDGSIFKADLFPELAKVVGIGEDCKFAKDPQNIGADEFQLPDLGSKYLVPGMQQEHICQKNLVMVILQESVLSLM